MNDSAGTDPAETNPAGTDSPDHRRHVILGAGPVGQAIAAHLVDQGVTPTIVTRSGTSVSGATTRRADIIDPGQLAAAVAGADVVYQCAQPAYHRWQEEFPSLQAGVIDAVAASGSLLVVVENLYGYGPVDGELTEDLPLRAGTRKGAVRARMYLDLVDAHQAGRIRMVVARASDFFGPHVDGSAFGERFLSQVVAGRKVDILGDPDARHSVTFVVDLAAAMVRLAEAAGIVGPRLARPERPGSHPARTRRARGTRCGNTTDRPSCRSMAAEAARPVLTSDPRDRRDGLRIRTRLRRRPQRLRRPLR